LELTSGFSVARNYRRVLGILTLPDLHEHRGRPSSWAFSFVVLNMLHLYAALAEKERRLISERTRVALAQAQGAGRAAGQSTKQCRSGGGARANGTGRGSRQICSERLANCRSNPSVGRFHLQRHSRGVECSRLAIGTRWHVACLKRDEPGCEIGSLKRGIHLVRREFGASGPAPVHTYGPSQKSGSPARRRPSAKRCLSESSLYSQ